MMKSKGSRLISLPHGRPERMKRLLRSSNISRLAYYFDVQRPLSLFHLAATYSAQLISESKKGEYMRMFENKPF